MRVFLWLRKKVNRTEDDRYFYGKIVVHMIKSRYSNKNAIGCMDLNKEKIRNRKTILYIAMSLDGYIADRDGGVHWLQGSDDGDISSYSEFVKDIDTILMGWNTYHQVVTELSPTEWIYGDFTTYVITHNKNVSSEQIQFTDKNLTELLKEIKSKDGKHIWICGGASLVQQLMNENLIDYYYISIIPTLLGNGIRLFGVFEKEQKLSLIRTQNYNGIVEMIYEKRNSDDK